MARSVGIIGSGNWGSTVCRILTHNVKKYPELFNPIVSIWVKEEKLNDENLSEIIKRTNENIKYLPGHFLGTNLNVETDLIKVTSYSQILVFVVPHQFIDCVCEQMKPYINKNTIGISLIKGLFGFNNDEISFISDHINKTLNINVSVLSGANIADEIANGFHSEATIGCLNESESSYWVKLFSTPFFHVQTINEVKSIEICGALKNVLACAVGFAQSTKCKNNTLAAVIRIGAIEIREFIMMSLQTQECNIMLESCGIADIIASSMGGRNSNLSKLFCESKGSTIEQLEQKHLNGQKLQGPSTSKLVQEFIRERNVAAKFPLLFNTWSVFQRQMDVESFINLMFR